MSETEVEKAKRYLLGEYTQMEEIGLDLSVVIEEFENKPNTAITRHKLEQRIHHELRMLKVGKTILDYQLDVTGCAYETTNINITMRQNTSYSDYIRVDFDIK